MIADSPVFIVGDFNCPLFASGSTSAQKKLLMSFMELLLLRQMNIVCNANERLLDLMFSNIGGDVKVVHNTSPFVPEDMHHPALDVDLCSIVNSHCEGFKSVNNLKYNFKRADYMSLYSGWI